MRRELIFYVVIGVAAVAAIVFGLVAQGAGAGFGIKLTGAGTLVGLGAAATYAVRAKKLRNPDSTKSDDEAG